jgi:hypothetical protein
MNWFDKADEAIEYLSKFYKERNIKHISIERVK